MLDGEIYANELKLKEKSFHPHMAFRHFTLNAKKPLLGLRIKFAFSNKLTNLRWT